MVDAGEPRRIAYADPPYPGLSARYYRDHPDYAGEVDHAELVAQLLTYDAWALSTNASSLQYVLGLFPVEAEARVAAWVRGERPNEGATIPLPSWEPLIYGGQIATRTAHPIASARRVDSLVHHSRPRTSDPDRVIGSKPARFAGWLFDLLVVQRHDTFVDLFPGSGGMTRAHRAYLTGELQHELALDDDPDELDPSKIDIPLLELP